MNKVQGSRFKGVGLRTPLSGLRTPDSFTAGRCAERAAGTFYVAAAFASLILSGCPASRTSQESGAALRGGDSEDGGRGVPPHRRSSTGAGEEYDNSSIKVGRSLSLFAGTLLMGNPPDSIAFNLSGERLYARGLIRGGEGFYVAGIDTGEGGLGEPELMLRAGDIVLPYILAHPFKNECLVSSHRQQGEAGDVFDVIWRVSPATPEPLGSRSGVPYEAAPSFPTEGRYDEWYGLKPFYTWDGAQVVVPLRTQGISIVDTRRSSFRYIAYPEEFPGEITNILLGPLPDEGEARRLWASIWKMGRTGELCQVYVLELDTGQWQLVFELDWLVYQVGVSSVYDEPWLVSGSRFPNQSTELRRVPILARIVPGAGVVDILELWGDPVWEIAIEPRGKYAAYMDRRRRAMARLEPSTGSLDLDYRWFSDSEDGKLFINEGGGKVFFWQRDVLVQAEWAEHEQFKGHSGERAVETLSGAE